MVEKAGLRINGEKESYICNEAYYDYVTKKNLVKSGAKFDIYKNDYISNMIDLIQDCLVYHIDVTIPPEYKITKIYNIVFTTADFEPDNREYSRTHCYTLFSSTDEKVIKEKFKRMCKKTGKATTRCNDHNFCWHTEDFAHNQIIHSYDINESYIIEEVEIND